METELNHPQPPQPPWWPQPQPPQRPGPQPQPALPLETLPPTIYVYEDPEWEYKLVTRDTSEEQLPKEEELNALGLAGWELAGTVTRGNVVYFYFKRRKK